MRLLLSLCLLAVFSSCDTMAQPSEALHYSEVDVRPEPIEGFDAFSASIEYPELARRADIEGTVLVHLTVDRNGSVVYEPPEYEDERVLNAVSGFPACYGDPGGNTCETSLRAIRAALLTPAFEGTEKVSVEECFAFEVPWLPEGKGNSSVPTRIRVSPCP